MKAEDVDFDQWAIVELFGHRRAAGRVTEALFPAGWIRLEIPAVNGHGAVTQLYNPSALYGLHPVTEEVARRAAASFRPQPVSRWELERPAPAKVLDEDPAGEDHDPDGHDEDDDEDWADDEDDEP